ncbi:hypothetical protein Pint_04716 [Pistacia integerrima]|uniref:Uncharacterized protein n=1 Tax=Pistacia integerrima TaxID=434235 RepID=A0ACC0Z5B7_9ROSI|nr:hypothetical protein Pint_04716 [Pistacia integerrima]
MLSILNSLGVKTQVDVRRKRILVNSDGIRCVEPCLEEMRKIRGGFFVIGPLLARFGEAIVGLPGGCDIGERPVDLDGKVLACAANGRGLIGGNFHLDYPSVGATETLMMAASMADGVTVLSNVAKEPEVIDLARFLNDSGACVTGAGSDKLLIKGKFKMHGSECVVPPDRIEVGTFMIAAAITRSCISISPVIPSYVSRLIDKLTISGCKITQCNHDTFQVSAVPADVGENLQGFDVKTSPFPGFPTDLQPQTMALLTTCNGLSIVEESVFDKRMGHVREMQKLGAEIHVCGSTALVFGREKGSTLRGSRVDAADLRGGVSLVLAGLAAEGTTEINGIAHVDRGYENLDAKLQFVGANIKRLIPAVSPL